MNIKTLDGFTRDYLVCALWVTNDESGKGEFLDENYDLEDIAPEALKALVADCQKFQEENMADIKDNLGQAGHDFFLTRNGHGVGFWDRPEIWIEGAGDRLTEACKAYPEIDLYVGDDGKIHV